MKSRAWALVLMGLVVLVFNGPARADEWMRSRLLAIMPVAQENNDDGWSERGDRRERVRPPHRRGEGDGAGGRIEEQENNDADSFGGWGGVSYALFFPDLHEFRAITEDRDLPGFKSPLGIWAGRGFVSVNNLRIGGLLAGGAFRQEEDVHGHHRVANLDLFYGGVSLDYLIPVNDRIGFFGGGTLGGGGVWMSARGGDLKHDFAQGQTFGFVAPEIGASFKVASFMRLELTGQYNFMNLNSHGSYYLASTGARQPVDITSLSGPQLSLWLLWGYGN
jgi:hypothetical protein